MVQKHCSKNEKGQFVCFFCHAYQRGRVREVRRHIQAVHFGNKDIYMNCPQCGQEFEEKEIMQRHIDSKHSDTKSYHCDKCPSSFGIKSSLLSHIRNMHGVQVASKCEVCDKEYSSPFRLKIHIRNQHEATKSFVCQDCGKSFKVRHNMEEHRLLIHSTPEEREKVKIPCEYPDCDYKAMTKTFMKRHVDRMHLKIRRHQCPHCAKPFEAKYSMDQHINGTHLGLKPLKCDTCDFCTAYTKVLSEHKKTAHGTQRYECPYCNHVAKFRGNLRKHMNNVHHKILP